MTESCFSRLIMGPRVKWAVVSIAAVLFYALFFYGAAVQGNVINRNPEWVDQSAYLGDSLKMRELGFRYAGPRSRMPAYPFLQSLFLPADRDLERIFERGKSVNTI